MHKEENKYSGEAAITVEAVRSIRQGYYDLIAQDRRLIGAATVLDMIDAALAYGERDDD